MANRKVFSAPCNDCGRKTDHVVLKSHTSSGADQKSETWWETRYDMMECCGCHFISLKRTFSFSEYDEPEVEYFPPPVSRRKPEWALRFLPSGLRELTSEIYSALHANNRRLATMGARAMLDMAIVDSVGDVGTFHDKLDALQSKGLIAEQQRQFVEAALEIGHAAGHRGHCPTAENLNLAMDIVENILQQIYVLPHAVVELKKSTPARSQRG